MTAVHAAPTNDINDILEMILGDIVDEKHKLGDAVKGEQRLPPLGYDKGDERKLGNGKPGPGDYRPMWTNTDKDDEDDDKLEKIFRRLLAFLRRLKNKQG
jgi:hypothetical protein